MANASDICATGLLHLQFGRGTIDAIKQQEVIPMLDPNNPPHVMPRAQWEKLVKQQQEKK
jgi:hypothetical protein